MRRWSQSTNGIRPGSRCRDGVGGRAAEQLPGRRVTRSAAGWQPSGDVGAVPKDGAGVRRYLTAMPLLDWRSLKPGQGR